MQLEAWVWITVMAGSLRPQPNQNEPKVSGWDLLAVILQAGKQTNKPLGTNSHLSAGLRNIPGLSLTSGPEGRGDGGRGVRQSA